MKKTLLFFILLFSNYFYAQVNDIEHCYGDTRFNLTLNQSALLGNLNPVETTISYHVSAQEATANTNAIAQPASYNSTAPSTTIYARIDNKGTVTTNYFNLKIYNQINAIPLTTPVRCKGENNGILTVAPSGGKTPYAYSLDGGSFTVHIGNPIGTFTNLSAGTHTIAVKDALGCQSMLQTFQITEPSALTVKLFTENQTVVVNASGGTSPYQYSLDGINYQTSYVFSNMPVGSYTFRVKDAQGCITSESVNVYYPLAVGTQILKPIDCIEKARVSVFAAGGSAPYLYAVNKGPYQPINVFSNLAAGDYVFEVKDVQNVVRYANVTIAEFVPLSIATAKTDATTNDDNDGTITVTANGALKPYTYTLTDNAGNPLKPSQPSNSFTGLKSGTYGVLVNDATNCIASQTNISILKKPAVLAATVNISPITCSIPTGTITVVASGGKAPYKFSADNGNTFVTLNIFSGLAAGIYTVKVRDAENTEIQFILEISPLNRPLVNVTTFSNVRCKGDNTGSASVETTGGKAPYKYAIDGGPFSSASTFTNLRTGTYNITVQDANGCTALASVHISEPTEGLSATAIPINDQGIIVNAKGGTAPYLYSLQNNLGVVIAGPKDNGVFTKLPLGVYTAQVTDVYGCGYMQGGINVIPAPPLSATTEVIPATCSSLGKVTVTANGGIAPYNYSLDNEAAKTSNVFSNLAPGNYSITVRDANNATYALTFKIAPLDSFVATVAIVSQVTCFSKGIAQVIANGGKAPYLYSINGGSFQNAFQSTTTFTGLNPGDHVITIKDANDCKQTIAIHLAPPVPVTAVATVNNQTITVTAAGGSGNYQFSIDGAVFQSSNIFTIATYGVYRIVVRDQNGCVESISIVVNPPAPLINGKKEIAVAFKTGQTLGDLIIEGQNIKWYSTKGISTGKTSKTSETPLPPTTLLVDGVTYYASQTIDGIESTERLAVTAKVNGSLATSDFVLPDFKFYPNPVHHTLSIHNTSAIDEIELISVSGKSVLAKKINDTHSEIDLSNVTAGFYFLKVKAEGQLKTIKIVKK
ncbi:T9SS type A sorting domain-containing protein [Flavobacterium collinsii]|uniref:Secretion system C-terminal sorting domain-containing protein n=1 Tax=Flavobacterium collinsii TaxID=1114861 RepID=A0ABN7EH87_9FLAO|nr:T9SS type A sorting domain-containing protein [Flavobacterium collinsii]CAA9196906.1 hypothetical protein FLACOL7796_01395 [Flavobacterium collinsii]